VLTLGIFMKKLLLATTALIVVSTTTSFAADMAARPYTKAAPMVATGYNWNGFYVGGHGGYGWGATSTTALSGAGTTFSHTNPEGGFGGGQIGYNYVFAPNWLIGIEGDGSAGDISSSRVTVVGATTSTTSSKIDALYTVRGRLGYFWDNVLVYATGGYGWFDGERSRVINASAVPALVGQNSSVSSISSDWVVGAGLEWGFLSNWSAKAEYLYSEYNTGTTFTYTLPGATVNLDSFTRLHTVKVGINYHFGGPVVAKY
jgi:outer membrane immunogenic protein